MLQITPQITINLQEIEINSVRSQGAGGQHVNKVSSAIHLRFDVHNSSLPEEIKEKLLHCCDSRITKEGVIIIKAQEHRSQKQNRDAALYRLGSFIREKIKVKKARRPTKPSIAAKRKRLEKKKKRSLLKKDRRRVD